MSFRQRKWKNSDGNQQFTTKHNPNPNPPRNRRNSPNKHRKNTRNNTGVSPITQLTTRQNIAQTTKGVKVSKIVSQQTVITTDALQHRAHKAQRFAKFNATIAKNSRPNKHISKQRLNNEPKIRRNNRNRNNNLHRNNQTNANMRTQLQSQTRTQTQTKQSNDNNLAKETLQIIVRNTDAIMTDNSINDTTDIHSIAQPSIQSNNGTVSAPVATNTNGANIVNGTEHISIMVPKHMLTTMNEMVAATTAVTTAPPLSKPAPPPRRIRQPSPMDSDTEEVTLALPKNKKPSLSDRFSQF